MNLPDRRRWLRESGSTAIASALGQGPGVLVGPLVAVLLGATAETDAAFLALSIATFATVTIAGAAQFVVVPFLVGAERDGRAVEFLGQVRRLTFVSASALAGAIALAAVWMMPASRGGTSSWPGVLLLWLLCPYIVLSTQAGLFAGALNARRKYWAAAISPAWRWVTVLVSVAALTPWLGAYSLIAGYVVGEGLRLLRLRRDVARLYGRLETGEASRLTRGGLLPFMRTGAAQIAGSALIAALPVLDRTLAAGLPAGSISILEYADRLWQVPVGFAMSGLLVVTLSDWSREVQTAAGVRGVVSKTHRTALLIGLAAILPCAVVVWQRLLIAGLLFGHGDFPASAIPVLADTLGSYVAAVPFYLAGLIYTRAFLALQRAGWILLVAVIETGVKLAVNWPLLSAWGVPGLAMATGLMYVGGLVMLVLSLKYAAGAAVTTDVTDAGAGKAI